MASLAARPLLTKSVTTATVELLGDAFAQRDEALAAARSGGDDAPPVRWDRRRSFGSFLDGLCCTGPLLHYSYGYLDRLLPSKGVASVRNALVSTAIDEFICDPLDVAVYLATTSLVEGKAVGPRLKAKYWPTLRDGLLVSVALTPLQFLSFRYLPVECRVLAVNAMDMVWMCAVSLQSHAAAPAGAAPWARGLGYGTRSEARARPVAQPMAQPVAQPVDEDSAVETPPL